MTRHLEVRPIEPGHPSRGWSCPWCPANGLNTSEAKATYAATVHALTIHGKGQARVDVYDDSGRQMTYGYCDAADCDEHGVRHA